MKYICTIYGIAVVSVIAPLYAFAQFGGLNIGGGYGMGVNQFTTGGIGGSYYGQTRGLQITSFQSILGIINTLLGYMQVGIFFIALFYFLYGAYDMVGGDVAGGGKKMGYAAVGVAAAILAFSIIPLVCFITQSNGPACWL